MEEEGVVVSVPAKGTALVRLTRSAACAGCAAAGACHTLGAGGGDAAVEAEDPLGVSPGDAVQLRIPSGTVLRASLALYLVPLLVLLVVGGAVQSLAARWLEPSRAQLAGVLAGLAATVVAHLLLRRTTSVRRARPVIVAVARAGEGSPPAGCAGVDGGGGAGLA